MLPDCSGIMREEKTFRVVFMPSRGRPKAFEKEEFKELVLEYMNHIYDMQNKGGQDTPTFFGFYRYVSEKTECSYHTVRRCFDEYWADIKKDFEEIRGDLISRGASMGVYNVTMSIFALKNWCHWKDKAEPEQTTEAEEKQKELLRAIEKAVKDGD